MKKKIYIQPDINVVILQQQNQLMQISGAAASDPSGDMGLGYEESGDDPNNAW